MRRVGDVPADARADLGDNLGGGQRADAAMVVSTGTVRIGLVILRCTRKLLTVIKPAQFADSAPDGEDWYANLLRLGGRRCLLLTHASTLFTIFEPGVRTAGLRDPGRLVTGLIRRELEREHLPQDTFGALEPRELVVAKTSDRSVLGCMNDMAFMWEWVVGRADGLASTDIAGLNQSLLRNINSARSYTPPIELVTQRLRVNQ